MNNAVVKSLSLRKTGKQRKKLFEIDIKTKLYNNDFTMIWPESTKLKLLNKPAYAGMCMLELSKVSM